MITGTVYIEYVGIILWMEEILHQLIDGLSHSNPMIYSAS